VALASERFDFVETDYYQATMGDGLKKQFWAFERLVDPGDLPERKRTTNEWETLYAESHRGEEPRPLNLDPGYITLGKLVLASTKDHCHRLYLGDGIYGEATLHYRDRAWRSSDWTYPDYRREDFQAFFSRCRQWLKLRLRDSTHRAT
jgi:hypothetical protein